MKMATTSNVIEEIEIIEVNLRADRDCMNVRGDTQVSAARYVIVRMLACTTTATVNYIPNRWLAHTMSWLSLASSLM